MRYSSRFFLYGPFLGLLILSGLVSIHWWSVANALADRLDRANGHEISPGVRLSFSEKRLAGFPFRLDVVLKNLRIEVAEAGGPIVWTTEEFAAHALSYGRVQTVLESAGKQTLSWTDARGGAHAFSFLPGTFRASALLEGGRLIRFDSEIVDLDGDVFRTRDAQLHFRSSGHGIDLYLKLNGAHVTGGYAAALGPDITTFLARGRMDHGDSLERMLGGMEAPQNAFDRWRDAGGRLTVDELSMVRGRESVKFSGPLTLDGVYDLAGVLNDKNGNALVFSGDRLQWGSRFPRP